MSLMLNRRMFLAAGLAAPLAAEASAIVDTHTHFYDPTRPQGVPWPPASEKVLYRQVRPAEYLRMVRPLGIAGTIVVEASPWLEDNQWVLDLAANEPAILGVMGHLDPGVAGFPQILERYLRQPLFRGIRLGAPSLHSPSPDFIAHLKLLADAGLAIDAIGGVPLLHDLVRLTDRVPNLRIIVDHLPFEVPQDEAARQSYHSGLQELGKLPQVFIKVSNVVRVVNGRVSEDLAAYRPALDELWDTFGSDRLVYGSNWPVSDRVAPFAVHLKVVKQYFGARGAEAADKYFSRNSQTAYRWKRR